MTYDDLNDDAREKLSHESLTYINALLAEQGISKKHNELIRHLSREITTLIELRGRFNIARSVLAGGGPNAARLALMALDGTSIDQIIREANATDQAR